MTGEMEGKQKIKEYRERLDKTLASNVLVDEDSIRALVKDQLIRSSPSDIHGYIDNFIEKRSVEVSNFLDMLRSVSRNDNTPKTHGKPHGDWKLKQDNEDYRVMYREGPQGTPFHTLLVEGYVDGPLDVCLCLSWEATLYWKWWPQFTIPPFKIITSKCVQKVRIGEQICLVRMKVPWPLSSREAVVHYFELEYFEDDLVIVLLNSVSNLKSINKFTNGFTSDGITEAKDIVRIDLVGGYALQKVTSNRSYFRTIATMDMKLDFVPPPFINFVSRQLIGSGFKLYQKTVASIAKGDKDFGKALKDPLYARVREGLNHENQFRKILEQEESIESEKPTIIYREELKPEILQADSPVTYNTSLSNHSTVGTPEASTQVIDQMLLGEIEEEEVERETQLNAAGTPKASTQVTGQILVGEIEEEETERKTQSNENAKGGDCISCDISSDKCQVNKDKKVYISSEVEHALNILNDAISAIRGGGLIFQACQGIFSSKQELLNLERVAKEVGSSSSEESASCLNAPNVDNMDKTLDEAEKGSCSPDIRHDKQESPPLREVNYMQIVPASPDKNVNDLQKSLESTWSSLQNGIIAEVSNNTSKDLKEAALKVNGFHENIVDREEKCIKKKKQRRCCFFLGHM